MNLYFADTSYFLALLIHDDEHHERAVELAQARSANYTTTAWVLAEVGAFLADPKDRTVVVGLIRQLRTEPFDAIEQPSMTQFLEGLRLFEARPDKSWSLTDCISFIVMKRRGIREALTADRHFVQAGFKALLR